MPGGNLRRYYPEYQAARSRQLRANDNPTWVSFYRHWMAFNALYILVSDSSERVRVVTIVERNLDEQAAEEILSALSTANIVPPDPPPGNTALAVAAPNFRDGPNRALAAVRNDQLAARTRLASMMKLVYQVRCSLVHGNKNPNSERDNQLVAWGLKVLELVVPALEAKMAAT